jgi:hypothetical protein
LGEDANSVEFEFPALERPDVNSEYVALCALVVNVDAIEDEWRAVASGGWRELLHAKAAFFCKAYNERLTQNLCKLDGVDTGGIPELRASRKAQVQRVEAMTAAIDSFAAFIEAVVTRASVVQVGDGSMVGGVGDDPAAEVSPSGGEGGQSAVEVEGGNVGTEGTTADAPKEESVATSDGADGDGGVNAADDGEQAEKAEKVEKGEEVEEVEEVAEVEEAEPVPADPFAMLLGADGDTVRAENAAKAAAEAPTQVIEVAVAEVADDGPITGPLPEVLDALFASERLAEARACKEELGRAGVLESLNCAKKQAVADDQFEEAIKLRNQIVQMTEASVPEHVVAQWRRRGGHASGFDEHMLMSVMREKIAAAVGGEENNEQVRLWGPVIGCGV